MPSSLTCDVAIIGAGTAGMAAERSARRAGARTLLIDDGFAGTTCASVGCMPSKLLIAAATAAHACRTAETFGVNAGQVTIDGAAVMARVRRERDGFVSGVKNDLARLPEGTTIDSRARFVGLTTLELTDGRRIEARAIVIATGAAPSIPDAFAAVRDRVLTNETLFELPDLPPSVGVVGAGPLGLEMAQALAWLGVEVVVFDEGRKLGGLADGAPYRALHTALAEAFGIHLGVKLRAEPRQGGVGLSWFGETSGDRTFDYLLVAAGRPPRLHELGLEAAGLDLDDHGSPRFDAHTFQCGQAPVFIAGDADHDRPVLHEASAQGGIAGHNAAAFPNVTPGRRFAPLSITFTEPRIASIGTVQGPEDGKTVIGAASYKDQGRAKVEARNIGCVELYADAETGRLTGAVMIGPEVDHTAHLIAWSVQQGQTATSLLEMPFYHPTFEEGLKPALLDICRAVKATPPPDRDDGFVPGT